MACLCPPDNTPISVFSFCSKPKLRFFNKFSNKAILSLFLLNFNVLLSPRLRANAIFSATVIRGAVLSKGFWKTRLIYLALSNSFVDEISISLIDILPLSKGKTPDIALNNVDFPAPFPPIIVIKSPLLITRFIFFKA